MSIPVMISTDELYPHLFVHFNTSFSIMQVKIHMASTPSWNCCAAYRNCGMMNFR